MEERNTRNPFPQAAPGASAAVGHTIDNSIPLSIFPISADKLCFCTTGLPGRGKTHIAKRLDRYLSFFHALSVKTFDLGDYRRNLGYKRIPEFSEEEYTVREKCYLLAFDDIEKFFAQNPSGIAILDSMSITHYWRQLIHNKIRSLGVKIIFIEMMCEDETLLFEQYRKIATSCPDYEGETSDDAENDYRSRIEAIKQIYEPLSATHAEEARWSFLKCDHSQHHFVLHNVRGYLPLKVVHFIMNIRTSSHSFYLTRHGESEYNAARRIGGDSSLTQDGINYAQRLAHYVENHIVVNDKGEPVPARLWTSTLKRTKETAQFIKHDEIVVSDPDNPSETTVWVQMRPKPWFHLDEIYAGVCDGLTYEEIERDHKEEFELRKHDKLAYRYPRGDSYLDVIARLEPIIIEMERHREPLLIIGHQGILRIIFAFYTGLNRADAPFVSIPLNTVIKLTPTAYGCQVERKQLYRPTRGAPNDGQDEIALMDPPSH